MRKLSIVTACLNEERNIRRTLESVINQNFTDYEFIIIDGGSTDLTLNIIDEYKDKIDILISEKDKGIYDAMNKGIRLVNGEYVFFLNGGDYLYDDDTLLNLFKLKPKEEFIYGNVLLDIGGKFKRILGIISLNYYNLFEKIPPQPASFIKKELYLKIGFFDDKFKISGDKDFALRAILKYKIKPKYYPVDITVFDPGGISSKITKTKIYESRKAKKNNFPVVIFFVLNLLFKAKKNMKRVSRKVKKFNAF